VAHADRLGQQPTGRAGDQRGDRDLVEQQAEE
jgi:hypothetical protein